MPTYIYGDLWNEISKADLLLVTTCSYIDKDGRLCMGAGAAGEARKRYPSLPREFGDTNIEHLSLYGIRVSSVIDRGTRIGIFQTKRHFSNPSDLKVIEYSTKALQCHLLLKNYKRVALNFPGIGLGGLQYREVKPILNILPDYVYIYQPGVEIPEDLKLTKAKSLPREPVLAY